MRWFHRCLCLALGTFLGCGNDPTDPVVEYGMPAATVDLGGRVTEMGSDLPVPDVEVRVAGVDTVTTDADGRWSMMHFNADPTLVAQGVVRFVDVDGLANLGDFMDLDYPLDPANIYDGAYRETDILAELVDLAAEYGPPPAKCGTPRP